MNYLTSHTYNAKDDTVYKSIVLVGRKEALKVAEYIYHFLFDTGQTLWRDFKKKNRVQRGEKISFDMGFIAGIEDNHKTVFKDSAMQINKIFFYL